MKRCIALLLVLCLTLSGCSWLDGNYVSVTPHQNQGSSPTGQIVEAENYLQLRRALEEMISSGTENLVIGVGEFGQDRVESSMDMAVRYVTSSYPIGAYAVEEISYEVGTNGGVPAVAVQVTYLHSRTEIQKIRNVVNMDAAKVLISSALTRYDTSLVMLINDYASTDIEQLVEDYAADNPSSVMETPEVVAEAYPDFGKVRVLELKFTYQSSRDSLRSMQEQVQRIFESAALYVSADAADSQKYAQLYAFLMERYPEYQIKTSITPAYSLLNHGVGDSKAFAVVFAEMCGQAGLDCQVVVGTKDGQPHFWNMVLDSGYHYHVDLLECWNQGGFRERTDDQMTSYVWDYSAYPVCTGALPEEAMSTEPAEQTEDSTENLG